MLRSLWSGLLMMLGVCLAGAGSMSIYVAIVGAHPIRVWTSADGRWYQFVPQENPHPFAIGAAFLVAALVVGTISIRALRAKQ